MNYAQKRNSTPLNYSSKYQNIKPSWYSDNALYIYLEPEVCKILMFAKAKKPMPWTVGIVTTGLLGAVTATYLVFQTITSTSTVKDSEIAEQTVVVTTKDLVIQTKGSGTVQAMQKINVSPKEAGQIAQMYVNEGDWVEKDQLIARMENEQFQTQVDQYQALLDRFQAELVQKQAGTRSEEIAEAQARVNTVIANVAEAQSKLSYAEEELQRYQLLEQQGAISRNTLGEYISKEKETKANLESQVALLAEQEENLRKLRNGTRSEEITQAEAEVSRASAELKYYELQLQNTLIRAPFAGTITRRFAQEGDFVTPTTAASSSDGASSASIAELSSGLEVEAKVPEASIAQIQPNQPVEIRTDAYPDKIFKGSVQLISPRAVQENNITLFKVKVALQTEDTLPLLR